MAAASTSTMGFCSRATRSLRSVLFSAIPLALLGFPGPAVAQDASASARSYLRAAQDPTGAFPGLPVIDTVLAVSSLPEGETRDAAVLAVALSRSDNAEALFARASVLAGTPYLDPVEVALLETDVADGSLGLGNGWRGADPIVVARALDAISAGALRIELADPLLSALAAAQRADGGMGFADEPADPALTAEVARSVIPFAGRPAADTLIVRARGHLEALDVSGLPAADLALILLAGGQTPARAAELVSALLGRQGPGGDFDGEVRATALAIRALQVAAPDLVVRASPSESREVVVGKAYRFPIYVSNQGKVAAGASEAMWVARDPEGKVVSAGRLPLTALAPGLTETCWIEAGPFAGRGAHRIEVVVNPEGQIQEARWENNLLGFEVKVLGLPDLILEPSDITVLPDTPLLHETARASVRVRNVGESVANAVHVQLFLGDPAVGGRLLANVVLESVAPGSPRLVTANLGVETLDPMALVARVDPGNAIPEGDESNNQAMTTRAPVRPADFDIDMWAWAEAYPGPAVPQGEAASIRYRFNATITRFGMPYFSKAGWPFRTVPAVVIEDLPDGTARVVARQDVQFQVYVNIHQGTASFYTSIYTYELPRDAVPGSCRFRVVLDPEGTLEDRDRTNNAVPVAVEIRNPGVPELKFAEGTVRLDPPVIDPAHPATLHGSVSNVGLAPAFDVPVVIALPRRTVVRTIPFLDQGGTYEITEIVASEDVASPYMAYLTIDPDGVVVESTKGNNVASVRLPTSNVHLEIASVSSPGPVAAGLPARLGVELRNDGYRDVTLLELTAIGNSTQLARVVPWTTIPVGSSRWVEFQVPTGSLSGDSVVRLEARPVLPAYGTVHAVDTVLQVRHPDFVVPERGIAVARKVGPTGELLSPSVTVGNAGTIRSDTSVRVYRGTPAQGRLGCSGVVGVDASGSAVFECGSFPPPEEPPFVLTVVLDEESRVRESDETNNVSARPIDKNLGDVVVAFDETHGPGSTVGENPGGSFGSFAGDLSDLARDLSARGYVVETLNPGQSAFTASRLRGIDVLVAPTSTELLSPVESRTLEDFIRTGGGFLFLSEWGGGSTPPAWSAWQAQVGSLLGLTPAPELMKVGMICTGGWASFSRQNGTLFSHPVTEGVSSIIGNLVGGYSVVPPAATVLAVSGSTWTTPNVPVSGVMQLGSGRVGFHGDGTIADASIAVSGECSPAGSPYYMADNRRFVHQMIDWLANGGPADYPPDLAFTPPRVELSIAAPTAGDVVRVSAVVRNVGGATRASGPTTVRFFDGDPATLLAELPVPSLDVDQEHEVAFDWDTSYAVGRHRITAVVDPDGTVDEYSEENNAVSGDVLVRARGSLRIQASDLEVLPGSPAILSVRVHNIGYSPVPAGVPLTASAERAGGGPAVRAGEIALPPIPARGAVTVTLPWPGALPMEAMRVVAAVHPPREILDPDPSDDEAGIPVEPPDVEVFAPRAGAVWGGVKTLRWRTRSETRPVLATTVAIARSGQPFTGLGQYADAFDLDTRTFADGDYVLRILADDGLQTAKAEIPFRIDNASVALRSFGSSSGSITLPATGGGTSILLPAGSRVYSSEVLVDALGASSTKVTTVSFGDSTGGQLVTRGSRLLFYFRNGPSVFVVVSDDGGSLWTAPIQVTPPGVSVAVQTVASNHAAVHMAYQTSSREVFATASGDGISFGPASLLGSAMPATWRIAASDDGVALAASAYGALYVATGRGDGRSWGPLQVTAVTLSSPPATGLVANGRLHLLHGWGTYGTPTPPAVHYRTAVLAPNGSSSALEGPMVLSDSTAPIQVEFAGGALVVAQGYAVTGSSEIRIHRCDLDRGSCLDADSWTPEPVVAARLATIGTPVFSFGMRRDDLGQAIWNYGGGGLAALGREGALRWSPAGPSGLAVLANGRCVFGPESVGCTTGSGGRDFVRVPRLTPRDVRLDVGADGIPEAAWPGMPGTPVYAPDLADAMNAWLASHVDADDGVVDGKIAIPVRIDGGGAGQTVLRNLEVRYQDPSGLLAFAQPPLFSPGASPGVLDTTTLTVRDPGDVKIWSAAGALVRQLPRPGAPSGEVPFDGRSDGGSVLPSGAYGFGAGFAPVAALEIDDLPPVVSLASSGEGGYSGHVDVAGTATDVDFAGTPKNFARYALDYTVDGLTYVPIAAGSSPVNGVLGRWNAFAVPAGGATLRLRAWDRAGNDSSVLQAVTVTPGAPQPPVITAPTVAGRPIDVLAPVVTVSGSSEPGTTVTVQVEGAAIGAVASNGTWSLAGVTLPPGLATITASARRGDLESARSLPVEVVRYAGSLSVSAPAAASRGDSVPIEVALSQTSAAARVVRVRLTVLDSAGHPAPFAASPTELDVSIPAVGAGSARAVLRTGSAPAGSYVVKAEAVAGAPIALQAEAPLRIDAEADLSASLSSDREVYAPDQAVTLSATVWNAPSGRPSSPLTAEIEVFGPSGVSSTLGPIDWGVLSPGASRVGTVVHGAHPLAVGLHFAELRVVDPDGRVVARATAGFEVRQSTEPGAVVGALAVTPGEYRPGDALRADVEIQNRGGPTAPSVAVLLVSPATGAIVDRAERNPSIPIGGSFADSAILSTSGADGSELIAILTADGRALDAAAVTPAPWRDTEPPSISVAGFVSGELRAGTVTPTIEVRDESPVTWTATLGGAPYVSGTPVTAEGDYTLVVEAADSFGNAASYAGGFGIDTTPPRIELSGVEDGASYPVPPIPAFTVTDRQLEEVVATLDGAPFVSGTAVPGPGPHVLAIGARDRAGNRSEVSVRFHVAAVSATLVARAGTSSRVLVAVDCDRKGSCDGIAPFLRRTLTEAGIAYDLVGTGEELKSAFRTHRHGVWLLYAPPSAEASLHEEIREAAWAGGGLVVVNARPSDAMPKVGPALGVSFGGSIRALGSVTVLEGPLGPARSIALGGGGVEQRLEGARAAALSGAKLVASTYDYGASRSVTLTFDPEVTPTEDVARLLVSAVRHAATARRPARVAGQDEWVSFVATLAAGGPANLRITAELPPGGRVVEAPLSEGAAPVTWRFLLDDGESATRELLLAPGPEPGILEAVLAYESGGSWLELAAASVDVSPAMDAEELLREAAGAVGALGVTGPDVALRAEALSNLGAIRLPLAGDPEADQAVKHVLNALKSVLAMEHQGTASARTALGELLRALEIQWTTFQ